MGLLSFSGSKSKSRSISSSSSFDNLDQSGFNFGQSQSGQRIAFEDIFQNLFGGASAAASAVNSGALSRNASMLFSSGTDFLGQLQSGGIGADYLRDQVTSGGALAEEQIAQLSDDLGTFLTETVNPSIKSSGVSAMTLGGSRGEVARGIAGREAAREFTRGATGIRLAERGRLDSLAAGLMESDANRSTAALNMLPGLFGLAESSALSGLSPYAALAQIIGGPTVLSSSSAFDVGADSTTGRAGSRSSSSSSSSSKSVGLGFG